MESNALVRQRPDYRIFTMQKYILDQCYRIWEMSGFEGSPPNPYDVTMYPHGYIDQLLAWHQGVKYHEDRPRVKAAMGS